MLQSGSNRKGGEREIKPWGGLRNRGSTPGRDIHFLQCPKTALVPSQHRTPRTKCPRRETDHSPPSRKVCRAIDRQTDRQTDRQIDRQLLIKVNFIFSTHNQIRFVNSGLRSDVLRGSAEPNKLGTSLMRLPIHRAAEVRGASFDVPCYHLTLYMTVVPTL
jgi:hypothetical protein